MSEGQTLPKLPFSRQGVAAEKACALADVEATINEYGADIIIRVRDETQVARDRYNWIKRKTGETEICIRAFPVDFNPSEYRIERAGLRLQELSAVCWTSINSWRRLGLDFDEIEISPRTTVQVARRLYELRDVAATGHILDTDLYITLGLALHT